MLTLASRQTLHRLAIPVGLAPLLLAASLGSSTARAGEIRGASGLQSLGSVINGIRDGSCTAGHCAITGGTGAGSNLFHRFEKFDTRGGISGASKGTPGIWHRALGRFAKQPRQPACNDSRGHWGGKAARLSLPTGVAQPSNLSTARAAATRPGRRKATAT